LEAIIAQAAKKRARRPMEYGAKFVDRARVDLSMTCFEAVKGFAPAAVGLARSSALFSTCAISLRGVSGLVAAQVARHGGQYRPGKSKVARTSGCSSARKEHEDVGAATSLRRGRSARSAPLFAHDARDLIKLQQRFPVSDIQRPFSSSPWRAHEEEMLEAFMVRRGGCARGCCVAILAARSATDAVDVPDRTASERTSACRGGLFVAGSVVRTAWSAR